MRIKSGDFELYKEIFRRVFIWFSSESSKKIMDFASPVTAAVLNNISGVPPPNVIKEVKCEVCNILVSSYVSTIF